MENKTAINFGSFRDELLKWFDEIAARYENNEQKRKVFRDGVYLEAKTGASIEEVAKQILEEIKYNKNIVGFIFNDVINVASKYDTVESLVAAYRKTVSN